MLSIIIPAFNAERTLPKLINSILQSDFKDYEIIVVDDLSADRTIPIIKNYNIKGVFLPVHSGPAVARNKGAEVAAGEILVFLDSDVEVEPQTLSKISQRFKATPDVKVLVGTYSDLPLTKGYFPRFKALWFKSLFSNIKECTDSLEGFCVAIDKDVFMAIGEFNPLFQAAGMEDYELGCRLRQKYRLYFDASIQVRHHFPGFLKNGFRFFRRTYNFIPLFLKQNNRNRGSYLNRDGLIAISSLASFLLLLFVMMRHTMATFLFSVLIIIFILLSRTFIKIVLAKEGLLFTVMAIFTYYVNGIILGLAMILGLLRYVLILR